MARDKIRRNVVALCDVPTGQTGRPSKSLTMQQAIALLDAAERYPLHAYIVLSLLIGARTEELRALRCHEVDLEGRPDGTPPVPPSIAVYRSVRVGGDTKTTKSKRRLAMPQRCVDALSRHRGRLVNPAVADDLVFASTTGTPLDAHNVRRALRQVADAAGLTAAEWTPRELRHSFVSLLGVGCADRGHLAPRRPQRHGCHGEGLPSPAPRRARRRHDGDGQPLPARRCGVVHFGCSSHD
jgi:integrase